MNLLAFFNSFRSAIINRLLHMTTNTTDSNLCMCLNCLFVPREKMLACITQLSACENINFSSKLQLSKNCLLISNLFVS